jgi:YidC/Oxa1 family membrane protein insertase
MNDKKNSILAAAMMGLLFVGWIFWQQSMRKDAKVEEVQTEQTTANETAETSNSTKTNSEGNNNYSGNSNISKAKTGIFAVTETAKREIVTIENDLYIAKLSSKGGSLIEFTLKDYLKWDKVPAQLIAERKGELYLKFQSNYGEKIDTRDLYFDFEDNKNNYKISGKDTIRITAKMKVENGGYIEKIFTFHGDTYDFDVDVVVNGMGEYMSKSGYDFCWTGGMAYQEYNSVDEARESKTVVKRYSDIEELSSPDEEGEFENYEGMIGYAAMKLKYFGMAIIPQPYGSFTGKCSVSGKKHAIANKGVNNKYDIKLKIPYRDNHSEMKYKIYLGPTDYDILKDYELGDMVSFGWRFGIRQIGEYFILPTFKLLHSWIGQWGLTLIIFSIFMKLILTPFSLSQMRTAQKTKLLTPILTQMREKYADDPQEQQKQQMKIYSEYGVNPAGGCLPLLLQMPILFALFSVLRNAIELRQSEFIWWITDLSRPDYLFSFGGFSLFGISHMPGLAFLMGITMFIQQKMTITDPKQKAMVYMMPVMMTVMFAQLPSGLNLYYFTFNLLSIIQQVYMNKVSGRNLTLEDLKKAPKKEGWMARKMREAQEMAEAQGRPLPNSVKKYGDIDNTKTKNANYRKKKQQPKKRK